MKDLSDQIRTVHLTLVLVSFVLLATALQEPQRKIERSISDARMIYSLAQTLSPSAGTVGDEVRKAVMEYVSHSGEELQRKEDLTLEIVWPSGEKQIVTLYGAFVAAYLSDGKYEGEDDIENPAYGYLPFQVRSLADFIRFWDHNVTEQMVVVPKVTPNNIQSIYKNDASRSYAKSFRFLPARSKPDKTLHLHAGVEGNSLKFFTYPNSGEPFITIAVPFVKIPSINIQALLIKYAHKDADWLPGKFASSFPELNDRAKNLTTLDLRDLTTELNDEANRERDKIELLGAKLDPVILTRWGLLIVATCQFYLWLHLNALRSAIPKSAAPSVDYATSGWIGLYQGFWALIFTIGSLLVPSFITLYWMVLQWGGLASRWRLAASVNALVCLLLGVATVRTLLLVRANLLTTPNKTVAIQEEAGTGPESKTGSTPEQTRAEPQSVGEP